MPSVKHWSFPFTALLLLRAVPSCSSDGASAPPSGTNLREIPGIFAAKACEVTLRCLGPVADVAALRSDCVERATRQFEDGEFALFEGAIDDGRVDYDGSKVATCAQALDDAGCELLTMRFDSLCPDLFKGHTKPGDECSVDVECGADHFCRFETACPGTCTPLGEDGDACGDRNDCRDGLVCGSSLKCVEPVADGDACGGSSGSNCGPTSICAGATTTESGVCTSVGDAFSRDEGDACDPGTGEFCKTGSVCAAVALEDARVVLKCEPPSDGTACHVAVPEACPEGQFCVLAQFDIPPEPPYRVDLPGECKPLPGDGEPCGVAQPGQAPSVCRSTAVCVAGTCQTRKRLGDACKDDPECYSGVCKDDACAPTVCGE